VGTPPPPRPPDTRPWYKKKRFIIPIAIVALLVVVGIFSGGNSTPPTATTVAAPAATPASEEPVTSEPATTETAPSGPATAKVGEQIQFEDSFGDHAVDVTVTRSRISTGSEFEKPDHGLYVGFFIRVKAFKDGMTVPSLYVLAGGSTSTRPAA
jgi:hypothetical protein